MDTANFVSLFSRIEGLYDLVILEFKDKEARWGLNPIEILIINCLAGKDGQNASELARNVNKAATSFTPILDKLEKKGYTERRPDQADRRGMKIWLTKDGLSLAKEVHDHDQWLSDESSAKVSETLLTVVKNAQSEKLLPRKI